MGVFFDIQGAFDNIPIQSIKRALNKTSAKGMVADWIINMISNRKMELNWGNIKINRTIQKGCHKGESYRLSYGILSLMISYKNSTTVTILKPLQMTYTGAQTS